AVALRADHLVFLTGAPGVLVDPVDERSVVSSLVVGDGPRSVEARGGMGIKLIACREAIEGGVRAVTIADGRCDAPLGRALEGAGTRVVAQRQEARECLA